MSSMGFPLNPTHYQVHNRWIYDSDAGHWHVQQGPVNVWNQQGSDIFYDDGKVAVKTNNFTHDLTVNGTVSFSGGATGDVTGDLTGNVTGDTTGTHIGSVELGAWSIELDGANLAFKNGSNKFKMTTGGEFIATDDVTAFGSA